MKTVTTKTKRFAALFLTFIMVLGLIPCAELTASAATYSTVRYGSKGQDVKTLQTMLNTVDNAKLTVDGSFGKGTLTAVKTFQKSNGLTADGVVGPATWNVLSTKYAIKKSTLKIGSGKYAPGTYYAGTSYAISGAITSNNKITSVTVGIYKSNGTAAYVKTVAPNATSYNISAVASSMKFQSLAAGSYTFKVVAKDASTNTKTLVNNAFTVKAKSTLAIGSGKYAPGTYYAGTSYSINGAITSNYNVTSVTVGIYKADGTAVYTKSAAPNAKSYNISSVASSMKFQSLAAGSYTFKVVAKDATGTSKTLVNNAFTVKAKSTLAIGSGKYAPGTYTVGSSYSINGKITSNYNITSVTVGVYKADGTATTYVKSAAPNAKSYDIKSLDSSIKFGKIEAGSYIFKVVAKDATGTSKVLVNNAFTVKAKSTTKLAAFQEKVLANWVKPVRATYLTIPGTGRRFGASRSNGARAHAGIDYYVRGGNGTPVYAMQSGKVIEYIGNFYYGTSAVAVQHTDGSIIRYAEISSSLRVGNKVTQGQQIGKIKANTLDGGTMLHLELYLGTASGSFTNRSNTRYDYASGTKYQRRRDLVNPEFLLKLTRTK